MFKLIPVCLLVVTLVLSGIPNTTGQVTESYAERLIKCIKGTGEYRVKPAFFALATKRHLLTGNSVMKFDNVEINIGQGYDPSTSIFTAPEPGVYAFAVSFIKGNINYNVELDLMKNKDVIARGHADKTPWAPGSIQAIISLKSGDQIFIRQPRSKAAIWGKKYSMFTGHMI